MLSETINDKKEVLMLDSSNAENKSRIVVNHVLKRNGTIENYDRDKIGVAVSKAMKSIGIKSKTLPGEVAEEVTNLLNSDEANAAATTISVDHVHRVVENVIMDMGLHDLAREYILYRHNNMPNIFRKRTNLKPYEYPQLIEYLEAIRHSYWVHCVGGEDRVVTSEGMKTVKDLFLETGEMTNETFDNNLSKITVFDGKTQTTSSGMLRTGHRDLYTLKTVEGYEHTVTKDHRVMTSEGWKEAGDLIGGDKILLQEATGLFGSIHKPHKAFLAGHFQGDGCSSQGNLMWCVWKHEYHHIPELENSIRVVYEEEGFDTKNMPSFGVEHQTRNEDVTVRKMHSKRLYGHFEKNKVPNFVWLGDKETVSNYLRGLFLADGTVRVTSKNTAAKLCQTNERFIKDVQLLLLNLGIKSRIYRYAGGQKDMPGGIYTCKDKFVLEITRRDHVILLNEFTKIFDYRGVSIPQIKNENMIRTSDYVRFESLDYKRTDDVYCLIVNNPEMKWICNGFVTHNTEFNYSSDIQDMKVRMSPQEAEIVKKAMLAISQIEVQVKTFWAKIGDKMPKPEVQAVGVTFGESEVRHADAYANLLEIMGLNDEFEKLVDVPAIKKRIAYLEQSLQTPVDDKDYFHKIILFALFVENVSLFSQFLIMMSFNKHKNLLKGISNAVEATSKEEDCHARFGFELVNIIKSENPEWWDKEVISEINRLCKEAYKAEAMIVDWIYGNHDLDFLPKETTKEFLKHRFNKSLIAIGMNPIWEVNTSLVKETDWFEEEILSTKNIDFFVKRSTAYSKFSKSFTEDDLF
jgi:ribonucleoside-diphosphate reductase beta chain